MLTSFYHVGKITMDFFLGVQLHFTIDQRNRIQPYEYIRLAQEISEVWDGGTDGEEKKHTKGSDASGSCIA